MNNGSDTSNLLEVRDLKAHFPIMSGLWRRVVGYVRAVDGVSFDLRAGETLGLVGESGCGKTTTGRAIIRAVEPTSGEIFYRMDDDTVIEATTANRRELQTLRQQIQIIFQDPFASLNPRMTIFDIVADPLRVNNLSGGSELEDRVAEMLRLVGLSPAFMRRYPHAFSGGQRQRIGIARSLVLNPRLVIADEPVSALDVSVQAQILNLMLDLQQNLGLTYLFISHDLSVVQYISHRVAVMYVGKVVELAPTEKLFTQPRHPYTQALLSSVPVPNPAVRSLGQTLEGEVADPANPPSGCYFTHAVHSHRRYAAPPSRNSGKCRRVNSRAATSQRSLTCPESRSNFSVNMSVTRRVSVRMRWDMRLSFHPLQRLDPIARSGYQKIVALAQGMVRAWANKGYSVRPSQCEYFNTEGLRRMANSRACQRRVRFEVYDRQSQGVVIGAFEEGFYEFSGLRSQGRHGNALAADGVGRDNLVRARLSQLVGVPGV